MDINPAHIKELINKAGNVPTPFVIMDTSDLRETCRQFRKAFPDAGIYFSMKANHDGEVLNTIHEEGIRFDVASRGEISILKRCNISSENIIFSAPTKRPEDIAFAFLEGVTTYSFDSLMEAQKIARYAPGSQVIIRIVVDNDGSEWPLEHKFGVEVAEAVTLMIEAKNMGLIPFGVTFHVGSQNRNLSAWYHAMQKADRVCKALADHGIKLKTMDLGGGFPVQYGDYIPSLEEIAASIRQAQKDLRMEDMQLYIEPGRGLVGGSGILVMTVINRASRATGEWLYLDAGTFHGLVEAKDGFRFPVISERDGEAKMQFTLCGPTCDSADTIMAGVVLPADITLGDRVYFLTAGAYIRSLDKYNGIDFPTSVIV
ncbi:MAG: type III PLP-dependent enzyme [Anaerolineaceae bacterium]|nr:type III PLP-dependent enzyme [Anaerolineaceae bacterium]